MIAFNQSNFVLGVYVPVGGKQMITFMDDLNMPAKDTFGSQPPLELIRQWIDYGFWFDRQKQTMKYIKVIVFRILPNSECYSLASLVDDLYLGP